MRFVERVPASYTPGCVNRNAMESRIHGDGIGVHGKGIVLCDLASEGGGGGVYQQEGVVIAREGKIGDTEMALLQ